MAVYSFATTTHYVYEMRGSGRSISALHYALEHLIPGLNKLVHLYGGEERYIILEPCLTVEPAFTLMIKKDNLTFGEYRSKNQRIKRRVRKLIVFILQIYS